MNNKSGLIDFLEKDLNVKYMNDAFTWGQVKKSIEKYFEENKPITANSIMETKKLFDEGIAKYFNSKYELAQRMFAYGMEYEYEKISKLQSLKQES